MKATLIAVMIGLLVLSACLAGCTGAQATGGNLKLGIVV
jgi:Spy/CpxP family protein refolding chaperone